MQSETPLEEAVRLSGGPAALAKALGESPQTVSNWLARGEAPANKCSSIQQITGVDRRRLRSKDWKDYWPDPAPTPEPEPLTEGQS